MSDQFNVDVHTIVAKFFHIQLDGNCVRSISTGTIIRIFHCRNKEQNFANALSHCK